MAQERWHQGLPFLWSEEEFYDFLRKFLGRVYERVIAANPQATHVLDKHPGYSLYTEDINKLLPHARFIHMIRDGRDVAVSMVAARKNMGFGSRTILDAAATWKKHIQAAKQAKQYPDRYLEVRYEDLLTAGVDVLKTVFEFCNLPTDPKEVAKIIDAHQFDKMKENRISPASNLLAPNGHYRKGQMGSWPKVFDPVQRYMFDEIAGDLLCELGYAEVGWWADTVGQKVTLPISAAILTRKHIRKRVAIAGATILGSTLTN